jgi:hypothetical protein
MPLDDSIVGSLCDPSRPTFLFGCTPPAVSASEQDAIDIARKFAARGRVLSLDGYIVYDVQDESSRTDAKRPFPYRQLMEPSRYARHLAHASHRECVVYKAVTAMESTAHFENWLAQLANQDRHTAINVVGAPTSAASAAPTGPTTKAASLIASRFKSNEGGARVRFGAVCIAERHVSKGVEHVIMAKKAAWGAEWFITQGIYDAAPMIRVLRDYAALCREQGVLPKKVVLTFTPCGRRKTLEFIKWLGMQVPPEVEGAMFPPPPSAEAEAAAAAALAAGGKKPRKPKAAVAVSCELLCDNFRRILEETAGCGVPLGINVESVSGFKDEIDATHDLFRSLQAILLDSTGSPWVVRWSRLGHLRVIPPHAVAAAQGYAGAGGELAVASAAARRGFLLPPRWVELLAVASAAAALGAWAGGRKRN